jgi:hypothetical protein
VGRRRDGRSRPARALRRRSGRATDPARPRPGPVKARSCLKGSAQGEPAQRCASRLRSSGRGARGRRPAPARARRTSSSNPSAPRSGRGSKPRPSRPSPGAAPAARAQVPRLAGCGASPDSSRPSRAASVPPRNIRRNSPLARRRRSQDVTAMAGSNHPGYECPSAGLPGGAGQATLGVPEVMRGLEVHPEFGGRPEDA